MRSNRKITPDKGKALVETSQNRQIERVDNWELQAHQLFDQAAQIKA